MNRDALRVVLTELIFQRQQIDKAAAAIQMILEQPEAVKIPKRRGRKSMGKAERMEVSARMKAYWAERRKTA